NLNELMGRHPIIGDVRGVGLIQGIELVADRSTKEHYPNELGVNNMLTDELKKRGMWIRVPAFILPISPPLTISKVEIDHMCSIIDESLHAVEGNIHLSK
ncbi:MAG: aspartate aminotransferase family protein, partial [Dehalococcoidia bacterium]|nr:aspartate aminotransferase family protein [Dehalococcoidia bacterium]